MILNLKDKLLATNSFIDNDNLDLYVKLIYDNINTEHIKYKTAKHHILPRSLCKLYNIDPDFDDNIINLYHYNHILAHLYLSQCSCGEFKYLSLCTLQYMMTGYCNNYKVKLNDFDILNIDKVKLSNEYQLLMEQYKELSSINSKNRERSKESINKQIESRHNNGKEWHSYETRLKIKMSLEGKESPLKGIKWDSDRKEKFSKSLSETRSEDNRNNHLNRKYINNGVDCLCIDPSKYDEYEKLGYTWGRITSNEAKDRMSNGHNHIKTNLLCVELGIVFHNTKEIKEYFGKVGHIYDCIHGGRTRAYGYTWKLLGDNDE